MADIDDLDDGKWMPSIPKALRLVEGQIVYRTDWGGVWLHELPLLLKADILTARFRYDGAPDGRSKRSVKAWRELQEFARARFEQGGR